MISSYQEADLSDTLFVLRTNIRSVNDILKMKYEEPYIKWISEYTNNESK